MLVVFPIDQTFDQVEFVDKVKSFGYTVDAIIRTDPVELILSQKVCTQAGVDDLSAYLKSRRDLGVKLTKRL